MPLDLSPSTLQDTLLTVGVAMEDPGNAEKADEVIFSTKLFNPHISNLHLDNEVIARKKRL